MAKYTDAGDVDLDEEDDTYNGERLTEAGAAKLANEILARHAKGRSTVADRRWRVSCCLVPTQHDNQAAPRGTRC